MQFSVITRLQDIAGVSSFNIYPNPTKGKLNIDIDLNTAAELTLKLLNSSG